VNRLLVGLFAVVFLSCDVAAGDFREAVVVGHWNVGHWTCGVHDRFVLTNATQRISARDGYRKVLADAGVQILGVCEYSPAFSIVEGRATYARDDVFGEFPVAHVARYSGANCNSFFMKDGFGKPAFREVDFTERVQNRYFTEAEISVGGKRVLVAETHLDFNQGEKGESCRRAQFRELVERYRKERRVIIMGDFNIEFLRDGLKEYDILFKAGYRAAIGGGMPTINTWPSGGGPRFQSIDNIFVKGFDVSEVATFGDPNLSDHLGVRAKLTLKEAQ